MIQEPQQPEIIEIPLTDQSRNTTVQTNLNKNSMLNQNNNKQKTLIQIQPKNLKPRIFLLTRPSKPALVRLETQRVPAHHPQKNATVTPANITSPAQPQTSSQSKIIRIPFLPRSQLQTLSVKSNINQVLKKDTIIIPLEIAQYTNESHNTDQESSETQTQLYPIIQKQTNLIKQLSLSPTTVGTSSNQSVKNNSIPQSTVTKTNQSKSQAQSQVQVPLTLASMAGIELTGADMSLSQADMSGAMPPTATVEEINVPVFIDEYLQEATATSTTSVTTNNFNINNNNNTSNNLSNNNQSYEKGNEVHNCLDTFENFEFDIDLLTENTCKDKETTKLDLHEEEQEKHLQQQQQQHNQQQQLTEVDDDKKDHQLDLQLMLEEILSINKNNSCNNNNSCKANNILNSKDNNNTTTISNYTLSNNMATGLDFLDELESNNSIFNVAPYSQMSEEILTPDDKLLENMDNSSIGTIDLPTCEYAVDFNFVTNEPSLKDCFLHSQPSDIMFSSGFGPSSSLSSSQNIINEISKAEPHIQNIYPDSTYSTLATTSSGLCETSEDTQYDCRPQYTVENLGDNCKETKTLINSLKRRSSQTKQHMKNKRLKLRLDTKPCKESVLPQQIEINTPNVINFLEEFADHSMGPTADNSIDFIYNQLISSSPTCPSVKSEMNIEETSVDFTPPNTPYSVNSISNQTNFTGFSAPSSPASSIATTTNSSVQTKRGRGRPAKTHSYIPDRSQIQHLSENEQKKILERAKNNEASRKSRLKHKERDNALEREEHELKQKNLELNAKLKEYKTMEKKLHRALKRQHFQYYNQNK